MPEPRIVMDCSTGNFGFGTTIPKTWVQTENLLRWGFSQPHAEDIKRNLRDPNSDIYWQQWEEVVRDALMIDSEGNHWTIEEDENRSLWMVPFTRLPPKI